MALKADTEKHNLELAEHQLKLQKSEKEGTFSKFSEDFSFSYILINFHLPKSIPKLLLVL